MCLLQSRNLVSERRTGTEIPERKIQVTAKEQVKICLLDTVTAITIEIIDIECVLDHESCLHFFTCVPL
jgi:cystathionine beta-lyase/cystathionine gamma-synthase